MNEQINSGAAVPFFTDRRYQTRYYADDGHVIIASSVNLIPFMFWVDAAPSTVDKFYLVDVKNGALTDLDETKINRRKLADNSKTWYFFKGEDLEQVIECGYYYVVIELGTGSKYYSDVLKIQNFGLPETHDIVVHSYNTTSFTLKATHVLNFPLSSAKAFHQRNGQDDWTEVATTIIGNEVTFNIPVPIPSFGTWYKIRYLYKTFFNWVERYVTLSFTNADPENTVRLEYIEDNQITGTELFELKIDNTNDYNNYLYSVAGVNQKLYLPGSFGFPRIVRQAEFEENGDGETSLVSSQTRQKSELTLLYVPDQFINILSSIGDYDSVTITDLNTGKVYNCIETEFAPSAQEGGYYSRGVLSFQSDYVQRGSCIEDVGAVAV